MTETNGVALQTALEYHHAWTGNDLDKAMSRIADDIVCDAPAGRIEGAEAYRAFLANFMRMATSTTLKAAFGDDGSALLLCDTETSAVRSSHSAEHFTVEDGRITYVRLVFDRAPFQAAG